MSNLEMNNNELKEQENLQQSSQQETKKISRRLLIKISLMSLAVVNPIKNLKANEDELNKNSNSQNITPKTKALSRDGSNSNPGGTNKPGTKGQKNKSDVPIRPPAVKRSRDGMAS